MATAIAHELKNPKNHTDLKSTDDASVTQQPLSPGERGGESRRKPAAEKTGDGDGGGSVTDVQKKMKRAERFGVAVHLPEVEKRNSRAERFGTAAALTGLDSSKKNEELKRKARAERFGVVQSTPADEEVKKKARLSRFGSSLTGSAEEDKKKARALRFSQTDSSSKANGEGKFEVKTTAIAGKAGGGA